MLLKDIDQDILLMSLTSCFTKILLFRSPLTSKAVKSSFYCTSVLLFCCLVYSFGAFCQPKNDDLGKKYWLLRSKLRSQFTVVGYDRDERQYLGSSIYSFPAGDKRPDEDRRYAVRIISPSDVIENPLDQAPSGSYWEDSCGAVNPDFTPYTGSSPLNTCKSTSRSYRLKIGDGVQYMGWYIGVLATEYKLLVSSNAPQYQVDETVYELFCAFKTLERLENKAHTILYGPSGASANNTSHLRTTGILLRDDIDLFENVSNTNPVQRVIKQAALNGFNNSDVKLNYESITNGDLQLNSDFTRLDFNHSTSLFQSQTYTNHDLVRDHIAGRMMSVDHTIHLLMGLGLTKKFLPHFPIAIKDAKGNEHGTYDFAGYINNFLDRLRNTLKNCGFDLHVGVPGDPLQGFPVPSWGGLDQAGKIYSFFILVTIDRIINNYYGDLYSCGPGTTGCSDAHVSFSKTVGISLLSNSYLSTAFGHYILNDFSKAYFSSAIAQSSPYFMGIQLRNETRDNIFSRSCDGTCRTLGWMCSLCDKMKTPYFCLRLGDCIVPGANNTCLFSLNNAAGGSLIFRNILTNYIGSLVGIFTGWNFTDEFCLPDPAAMLLGSRAITDQNWSYNITPGLLKDFAINTTTTNFPNTIPPFVPEPTVEFYNMLSSVLFDNKTQWKERPQSFNIRYMLDKMTYYGPYYFFGEKTLPRFDINPDPFVNWYWHNGNNFIKTHTAKAGQWDNAGDEGKFNGLDYMLAYNLACLIWPEEYLGGNIGYLNKLNNIGNDIRNIPVDDITVLEDYVPSKHTSPDMRMFTGRSRVTAGRSIYLGSTPNIPYGVNDAIYLGALDPQNNPGFPQLLESAIHLQGAIPTIGSNVFELNQSFKNLREAPRENVVVKPLDFKSISDSVSKTISKFVSSRRTKKRVLTHYRSLESFVASAPASQTISGGADRIVVFPNPVVNTLFVRLHKFSSNSPSFELRNYLGQIVLTDKLLLNDGGYYSVDLKDLSPGLYTLTITLQNSSCVQKLVKS